MTAAAARGLEGSCACSNPLQCNPARFLSVRMSRCVFNKEPVQRGVFKVDRCSPCRGCIWARLARGRSWPHQC